MTDPSAPRSLAFRLVEGALNAPALVILFVLVFFGWGLFNYLTMSRREDPEIRIATALVITGFPGAGAEQVEEQVTRKLETEIGELTALRRLVSTTRENLSVIHVDVEYSSDTDMAWQKLKSIVDRVRDDLPSTIIGPMVWDNFGDTTALIVAFTGGSPVQLRIVADGVKTELSRLSCAAGIHLLGEIPEVVYVEGRRAEISRYGVTPYQMKQALEMRNLRIPAGRIRSDTRQFRVEPTGAYDSVLAIEETILDVSTDTGQPVYVRDLFTVTRALQDPPDTEMYVAGKPATGLGIVMKKGCNVVQMGTDVRAVLEEISPGLPVGIRMDVVHDSPRQVDGQVTGFMSNLAAGVGLVVLFMALFMGIRPALISAAAIPLSVFIALSLMPSLSIDLELVSIAAFIVALGMLVDNSIIITDNTDIHRRRGLSPRESALRGAAELMRPVVVGTLGTVVAFLPMLLMRDEIGAYTRSLPLVVSLALMASLLVSLTLTPLMAMAMAGPVRTDAVSLEQTRTARVYRRFLSLCLRGRWLVALFAVLAFLGGVRLLHEVGFSFFPDAHRDQFTVDIWLREGATIDETRRVALEAEALLRGDVDVKSTVTYVGEGGPRFYITVMPQFPKSNYAQIMINTRSPDVTGAVIDRFNAHAATGWPGARVFAHKLVMGMPIEAPVEFRILGRDIATLRQIGEQVKDVLRTVSGAQSIRDNFGPDLASLQIDIDEERANRVGITNTDVALAFLAAYEGFELTRFTDGDVELPVVLRLIEAERRLDADPASLPVASNITGEKVPLLSIASIRTGFGPGVIVRRNQQRCLTVQAWNAGRLPDEILSDAWPQVSALTLPDGYRIEPGGEQEEMDKSFRDLVIIFGVIFVALLLLLVMQTGTLRRAVVVLLTVPLSVVGASIGLFVGGFSFSFMAFLGIISLAGMAVKNAVVWIDCVEQRRRMGDSLRESVILAGIYRLRPILLASVTTIAGLMPLALFGGVLFEPMAYAMIGGLALVTVFTLVVIPALYVLILPREP